MKKYIFLSISLLFITSCLSPSLKGRANALSSSKASIFGPVNHSFNLANVRQLGLSYGVDTTGDDRVTDLAIDPSGNVILFGYTMGNFADTNVGGNGDAIVAKFDSNHNLLWKRQLGNTATAGASVMNEADISGTVDSAGNVILSGSTWGSLGEANGGGNADIFIAKWDGSGNLLWIRQLGNVTIGAPSASGDYAQGITTDSAGNIYVCGMVSGSFAETTGGSGDIYFAKYSSAGALLMQRQLGQSTLAAGQVSGYDMGWDIKVDSSGNIFVTGSTRGNMAETNGNLGTDDAILAKWDSSGAFLWVRQLGNVTIGAGSSGTDNWLKLALDPSGNAYITGNTDGSLGGAISGAMDVFFAKYNSAGVLEFIKQIGASTPGLPAPAWQYTPQIQIDTARSKVVIVAQTTGVMLEALSGASDIFYTQWDFSGNYEQAAQLGSVTAPALSASTILYSQAFAIDSLGYFRIGISTNSNLGETAGGSYDVALFKF